MSLLDLPNTIIAPINIQLPRGLKEISFDNFKIRKIQKEEKNLFLKHETIPSFYRSELQYTRWALVKNVINMEEINSFHNEINYLRETLILYKNKPINLFVFGALLKPLFLCVNHKYQFEHISDSYPILNKDIKKIKILYDIIKSLHENSKDDLYKVVIERYQSALYVNTAFPNRFTDLVTILEALCVKNNQGEYSFRLAIILSLILYKKFRENKHEMYKNIKIFYKIRSEFVHSGTSRHCTKSSLNELLEITRKIIFIYVNDPSFFKKEDLIKELI